MIYFTENELDEFKKGSISYPLIVTEKGENEVIEVSQVVMLGGMSSNKGTPTEIGIQVHRKGKKNATPQIHLKKITVVTMKTETKLKRLYGRLELAKDSFTREKIESQIKNLESNQKQ
ncbi:hypothetical protein SAMN04489761_4653 [Tenacibaculum sp. MAR_2009_124]|uniref:hypothetical protein n=1 Tax=Tenacibaculum sp. MAR_2009_124 TaxID=1250059 RepID=UPI00089931AB|nr:hypothetical protein [Tenacibaculum sp. MAR_2009_124]SED21619.1 hypothetical protein SAMN04489761_4653 [Tenacibaculum sp. MAR_2009_124]